MTRYGMQTPVRGSFDEVKSKVVQALKEQGFGILSEIDVQKTLKDKIGVSMERYQILGACNPQLAQRALEVDRGLGLLLPCNVVVRDLDGSIEVSILDPERMFEIADEQTRATLATLPGEAKGRLEAALEQLKGGA